MGGLSVLLTGGTGFVGREVLRELAAAGHRVRVLAREAGSPRARELAGQHGAELKAGDVAAPDTLDAALAKTEAVIHLVGIISEVGNATFEQVHTRGTENLVAAARRAGVRRFVHMSALGTRPGAASGYHQTKWAAEECVRQSGLDYTIFRPSVIFGPEDAFVNLFARIIRLSPVVPIMGSGQARLQPVAVQTVAQAFVRALPEPKALGQTFDLGGPQRFTLDQLVDEILGAMDRRRLKLHIPLGLARPQAWALELLFGQLLRKAPPFNREQLVMLQEDNVGDAEPANALFGLKQVGFKDGIGKYVRSAA